MKPKCGTRTLFRTDGLFYEPSHWLGAKSLQSKTCLSTTDHAKQRPSDDHTGRKRQVTHSRHWLSTLRDPFCRGSAPAATALSYLICMPLISPDTASRPLPSAIKSTTPTPASVGRRPNLLTHFTLAASTDTDAIDVRRRDVSRRHRPKTCGHFTGPPALCDRSQPPPLPSPVRQARDVERFSVLLGLTCCARGM